MTEEFNRNSEEFLKMSIIEWLGNCYWFYWNYKVKPQI